MKIHTMIQRMLEAARSQKAVQIPEEFIEKAPKTAIEDTETQLLSRKILRERAEVNLRMATTIWHLLLVTLPLDLLVIAALLHIDVPADVIESSQTYAIVFLFVALLFIAKESLLTFYVAVKKFHRTQTSLIAITLSLLIAMFAVVGILDLVSQSAELEMANTLLTFVIYGAAVLTLVHGLKAKVSNDDSDDTAHIQLKEDIESQFFYLTLLPIFAARGVSLAGTVASLSSPHPFLHFGVHFFAALIFIIELMPRRDHFIVVCKGCAAWSSRASLDENHCPRCAGKRRREELRRPSLQAAEGPRWGILTKFLKTSKAAEGRSHGGGLGSQPKTSRSSR